MDKEFVIEELNIVTSSELDSIRDLVVQLSDNAQELSQDNLRLIIESPSTHLYVAKNKDGVIIGMVTLVTYRIPYKMKGWIEDVVVDQAYRGKGVATELLQFSIEEAKKYHVKSLNLTSNPARLGANDLYLKMGFVKRDTNVYRKML